jgi:DNA-binding transcriptional LysR family regulator
MVFLPHDKPFGEEFSAVRVAQYDIVYCSNCKEKFSNKKSISASDIDLRPLVLFKDSFFQTELIKLWFSSSGMEPNVILKTDQLSTMENIIKSKVADGFMFEVLAAENSFSVAMPLENLPPVSVSLVWKKDKILLESMKSFLSWIKKFKG